MTLDEVLGEKRNYSGLMAEKEKKDGYVPALVTQKVKDQLKRAAKQMDRTMSWLAGSYIMRGLAADRRRRKKQEPESVPKHGRHNATIEPD